MSHIGVISVPYPSTLNGMTALGQELQRRGHQVTFFHMPDIESRICAEGLGFWPIGESDYPLGSLKQLPLGIAEDRRRAMMICRDAPKAIQSAGVQFMLVEHMEPAGGSVAEFLNIPFVTVCHRTSLQSGGEHSTAVYALALSGRPMGTVPESHGLCYR